MKTYIKSEKDVRRILKDFPQIGFINIHKYARELSNRVTGERCSIGQFNTNTEDSIRRQCEALSLSDSDLKIKVAELENEVIEVKALLVDKVNNDRIEAVIDPETDEWVEDSIEEVASRLRRVSNLLKNGKKLLAK